MKLRRWKGRGSYFFFTNLSDTTSHIVSSNCPPFPLLSLLLESKRQKSSRFRDTREEVNEMRQGFHVYPTFSRFPSFYSSSFTPHPLKSWLRDQLTLFSFISSNSFSYLSVVSSLRFKCFRFQRRDLSSPSTTQTA